MKDDVFVIVAPSVTENPALRIPQKEGFAAIADFAENAGSTREACVVLPVGCGKSGLLILAPFALKSKRALLVAPSVSIARQLMDDVRPSSPDYFYTVRGILAGKPYPEASEIRGSTGNMSDFDVSDIIVTNIHQVQGANNRWLSQFPDDYFDTILFDEGHHGVADSWTYLRDKFPKARILSVSATPVRSDGKVMPGKLIYSYPIVEAVKNGYVKSVSGVRLNPKTLSYVREDDKEVELDLEEVRRLGEEDAGFRRSIVSSERSLEAIVDASIHELNDLRRRSDDQRVKIIASALNMAHCQQIVAKYRERGLRADYVHSREDSATNDAILGRLENHELDVIVQVRKLAEGFDHPYLAVAAVFSIFSSLAPFVQFVGRIMRVVPGKSIDDPVNHGVVVFHVGANITGVWSDFQVFAEADQDAIGRLVDISIDETVTAERSEALTREALSHSPLPKITKQGEVVLEEVELLTRDPELYKAVQVFRERGVDSTEIEKILKGIPVSKQDRRRAKRKYLQDRIPSAAAQLIIKHGLSVVGRDLDRSRENQEVVVSAIHVACNEAVGRSTKERAEFSLDDYTMIEESFDEIVQQVERSVFSAEA